MLTMKLQLIWNKKLCHILLQVMPNYCLLMTERVAYLSKNDDNFGFLIGLRSPYLQMSNNRRREAQVGFYKDQAFT